MMKTGITGLAVLCVSIAALTGCNQQQLQNLLDQANATPASSASPTPTTTPTEPAADSCQVETLAQKDGDPVIMSAAFETLLGLGHEASSDEVCKILDSLIQAGNSLVTSTPAASAYRKPSPSPTPTATPVCKDRTSDCVARLSGWSTAYSAGAAANSKGVDCTVLAHIDDLIKTGLATCTLTTPKPVPAPSTSPSPSATPTPTPTITPVGPTFTQLKSSVLSQCTSCHGSISTYSGLMNSGWVVAGDADNSVFVQAIEGGSMPPRSALAADQQKLARDWVAAGALNN